MEEMKDVIFIAAPVYHKLVEDRMLYRMQAERLQDENAKLTVEAGALREQLNDTQDTLQEAQAENKELAKALSYWYKKWQQVKNGQTTEEADQEEIPEEIPLEEVDLDGLPY